jgi:hypothetical protein
MGDLLSKFLEIVAKGEKTEISRILILIALISIIGPILSNYYYGPIRLTQQVRILSDIKNIDPDSIKDSRLMTYYNNVIDGLANSKVSTKAIEYVFDRPDHFIKTFSFPYIWKFLFGGSIFFIAVFYGLFSNESRGKEKPFGLLIVLIIGVLLGIIGVYVLPTFSPITINYVGYPIAQDLLLLSFFSIENANTAREKNETLSK